MVATTTVKERPILFSTDMVKAILDGRKTVTRRTTGLEEINAKPDQYHCLGLDINCKVLFQHNIEPDNDSVIKCPYGKRGDLLWVRETWAKTIGVHEPIDTISYKAGSFHRDIKQPGKELPEGITLCEWTDKDLANVLKWKPSIHMNKEYARIWLRITDVNVERLRDISEINAIAEGIDELNQSAQQYAQYGPRYRDYLDTDNIFNNPLNPNGSFKTLWTSINGKYSWDKNPWIWAVSFERVEAPSKVLSLTSNILEND